MAFDEKLASRIREALAARNDVDERKMFGGIAFLIRGNMCCGVVGETLMVRLGEEGAAAVLAAPHVKPMDFTGKPIKTMIYVEPAGIATAGDLKRWVDRGAAYAASLPPK